MMNYLLVVLSCCAVFASIVAAHQHKSSGIVQTSSGLVSGLISSTHYFNATYLAFKGIPYAEPPVGPLRFHPPQPAAHWTGVRDCFEHGPVCLQGDGVGSEDCLTLNVYTPSTHGKRAVMVYIPGGVFFRRSADSSLLGPDLLIEQDVVLVTLNYRLGMLGNLALPDPIISGNHGMKDQQLALHWIRQNVGAFGGDFNRITLFGQSAGGLSVQLHMLAPGSQGLFQRAIVMSTAVDARTTFRPVRPEILTNLIEFFNSRNTPVNTLDELIHQLMEIPAIELVRGFPFARFLPLPMPTVESSIARYPFIQGSPDYFTFEANFNLSIDVLAGYTSNEAIAYSSADSMTSLRDNFQVDIPNIHFNMDYTSETYRTAAVLIEDRYFPAGLANGTLADYARLMSHVYQTVPGDRFVRHLAQRSTGNTYHYVFDLDTTLNYAKWWENRPAEITSLRGAAHADDICYVFFCAGDFPTMYANVVPGTKEYALMRAVSGIYGRFARKGDVAWGAVDGGSEAVRHLHMGMDEFAVREDSWEVDRRFWDGIVEMFDESG